MKKLFLILSILNVFILQSSCKKEDESFLKIDKIYSEVNFDSNGSTLSVPINSNNDFEISQTQDVDWCHISKVGQSIKIVVDKSELGGNRESDIVVKSKGHTKVLKIKQNAVTINDKIDKVMLTNALLEFSIEITSSTPVEFELPEWIKGENATWESGTKKYNFIADGYFGSGDSRTALVKIKASGNGVNFEEKVEVIQTFHVNASILDLQALWQTTPFSLDNDRRDLMRKMEEYSVELLPTEFQSYLVASNTVAEQMEEDNPILSVYRHSFDYILTQVRNQTAEEGTAIIWQLYNMGYIIKTPSITFGIDINYRLAEKLEPYLDFICITHDHSDHKSVELMNAMNKAGKPVLSNFYTSSRNYFATSAANYTIGNVSIKTNITDHDATLKNFTTAFRIETGSDAGNFSILHCGDSSFDPTQFTNVAGGTPSLLILRNGNRVENNIVGVGTGKVDPKYVFLSHMIELRHQISTSPIRFTIMGTIGNVSNISNPAYIPFWGERFVWKNGELTK